jgi:DNA-binding winged helix-turn-helix (wHTH) protein/tetratricopeptide (TPR) repeat protein
VLDPESGELFKGSIRVRLSRQPFQILNHLLNHPERVVARQELRDQVWPEETYVDFEHSLNAAVNRLRRTLNDSADKPRFIETLPGRGYRFIGTVEKVNLPEEIVDTSPPPFVDTAPRSAPAAIVPPVPDAELPTIRSRPPRNTSRVATAIAAISFASLAGVWIYVHHNRPATAIANLVLADFTNRAGDAVFDETLRQALAIELTQSPHLSVISDQRIRHTLKLMGRPVDSHLALMDGREVCERIGGDAVLDGSIAKIGPRYLLALNANDCSSGDNIFREQAQIDAKADVLPALSHLATAFRSRAGESPAAIKRHSAPLPEATTPSIDALQAYSTGMQIALFSGFAGGIPHLKRAVDIDPNFALAHAYLGRLYADIGEPHLAEQATRRAFELRNRASERERFFITFSYDRQITGNLQKTQQTLDLWAQTYPLDASPHSLLSGLTTLDSYPFIVEQKQ